MTSVVWEMLSRWSLYCVKKPNSAQRTYAELCPRDKVHPYRLEDRSQQEVPRRDFSQPAPPHFARRTSYHLLWFGFLPIKLSVNDIRSGLICENDSMPATFLIHGRISHLEHRNGEGIAMTSAVWEVLSRLFTSYFIHFIDADDAKRNNS